MDEAPGHLCLDYEAAELVTLIHLVMLFGWDAHVLTVSGYGRAFVSHDEYVDFGFDDEVQCGQIRQRVDRAKISTWPLP